VDVATVYHLLFGLYYNILNKFKLNKFNNIYLETNFIFFNIVLTTPLLLSTGITPHYSRECD